jgi:hypothetical protein
MAEQDLEARIAALEEEISTMKEVRRGMVETFNSFSNDTNARINALVGMVDPNGCQHGAAARAYCGRCLTIDKAAQQLRDDVAGLKSSTDDLGNRIEEARSDTNVRLGFQGERLSDHGDRIRRLESKPAPAPKSPIVVR